MKLINKPLSLLACPPYRSGLVRMVFCLAFAQFANLVPARVMGQFLSN